MPNCEHFIYTAGKIGYREGYQVIAKSKGVSDEITENLREYMYPLGITVENFDRSKSLLMLKDLIAYSIVKNIGIGYDGRRGTLYTHTFIIKKNEFQQLNYDSRVFDQYFIEDDSVRGELENFEINPENLKPNFDLINSSLGENEQRLLFYGLLKKNKIAIVSDKIDLIQNILVALPLQFRLIPFSTLVIDPEKQYRYNLIQIPEEVKSKLDKNFSLVEPDSKISIRDKEALNEITQPFIETLQESNEQKLELILNDYEKMAKQISKIKRIKLQEIFDESYFEDLAKKENLHKLKETVRKLYTNKKFNQASPRVTLSITKKLRKIITNSIKQKIKKNVEMGSQNKNELLTIITILLDSLHFLRDHSTKTISPSITSETSFEITKLENILDNYSIAESNDYSFDPLAFAKYVYEQTVRYGQAWSRLFFGN